jgi:DNA-binding transcriptional LysR family regulator
MDLVCTDRVVDLIQEGFDVAIRVGKLADSTLVARNLGALRSFLVASPDYLAEHGAPKEPEELERCDCVAFGAGAFRTNWKLQGRGRTVSVKVEARLMVNDFDFVDEAARGGLGIAMLPVHRCSEHLRQNRLQRLLPEWCSPEIPLHAVYPSTRHLSPKVSAFLDHLREEMSPPPWEVDRAD